MLKGPRRRRRQCNDSFPVSLSLDQQRPTWNATWNATLKPTWNRQSPTWKVPTTGEQKVEKQHHRIVNLTTQQNASCQF